MYQRTLAKTLLEINQSFPVLLLTGPRQVGKTTLLEMCAEKQRRYVTLDNLDIRQMAQQDPGLFFQTYPPPILIDEVQYAPQLFSYIKIIVDQQKNNGLFWLTGSQKFHLMKGITESLAGRVAIVDLLGLSQAEIAGRGEQQLPFMPTKAWIEHARNTVANPLSLTDVYQQIWLGSFPKVNLDGSVATRQRFYSAYLQTYLQRDVKDILNITDNNTFYQFICAVAARTGQLLNYSDLAKDIGVDVKTIKAWLSVLETSGLVYLLRPYYRNVTKRLIKTPKLYFLDTGLCCYLTKWPDAASLSVGAMAGAILETHLFIEILKSYWHNGLEAYFYYYRDIDQKEIDLLIESGDTLYPVEFKRTGTPSKTAAKYFPLLNKLDKRAGEGAVICFVDQEVGLAEKVMAIPVGYL